jgi:hypothetical protein
MDKVKIIEKIFAGTNYHVKGKQYHSPLPPELQDWYCYTVDGGHSILCLLEGQFGQQPSSLLWQSLCPVPVKTVMRGYRQYGNFIVVVADYSKDLGLITDPEDDEF